MLIDEIRNLILQYAKLSCDAAAVADDADLFDLGMTSLTSVDLMLALENHFDVEFPTEMLRRATFRSMLAIEQSIRKLGAAPARGN